MGDRAAGEDVPWTSEGEIDVPARSRSFAELVATLQKLNELEAAIASAVARTRVPVQEVRRLLRAREHRPAENAPAFQFMREVFAQVGLQLRLEEVSRFQLTFVVDESPYVQLFPHDHPGRTCAFVSEAISRFLTADLDLSADVVETACRSANDDMCRFEAALDPVSVRSKILDRHDWQLLEALGQGRAVEEAGAHLGMGGEEIQYRMERIVGYGLANALGTVTEEGAALLAGGSPAIQESFEPPWHETSRLSESISHATSFAEAVVEVTAENAETHEASDEVVAMAGECRSFAELLAKASKGRDWE